MTNISLKNLYFRYQNSKNYILENCNLNLISGQIIGLVGLNGSGKSTLLKLLSGIMKPTKGYIFFDNELIKNIKMTKDLVTLLPENAKLFLIGPTVIKEFLYYYKEEADVFSLLKSYGLEFLINRKIYELSEGQRRLIAILSALQQQKSTFFLDEPTIGLDSFGRQILFSLLNKIKSENGTVIIATNDTRILPLVDRIIGLKEGKIVINDTPEKTLPCMYETIGIVPNQSARLISNLKDKQIVFPYFNSIKEMNFFLKNLED